MAGAALSGEVIVVHNDVTGGSPERARAAGAAVVSGPRRGYGHAGPPNVLYRARVSDSHCGMRAFRRFSPLADGVRHLRRLVGAAPRRRSASAER